MALSDYLTGDEWDACFYAAAGQHRAPSFGESMHRTIEALLSAGYTFSGLDDDGEKRCQVGDGVNAPKVCIWLGNPHGCDLLEILDNGRKFLKANLPSLVDESDELWAEQLAAAKAERVATTK